MGMWVLGSVIEPAEMEELDQHQFQAIDGYGGGVYAPTARLVIGGDGVDFTGGTGADPLGPLTSTAAPGTNASGAVVMGDGFGYGISATSVGINPGGFFASTGTGAGCYGLASSGNPGVVGQSSHAGQPGGSFLNVSGGFALDVGEGNVALSGSPPAPTADPGADATINTGDSPRVRGAVAMAAGGSLTLTPLTGKNFASAVISSSDHTLCTVTFARAMPVSVGINYWLDIHIDGETAVRIPRLESKSTTSFTFSVALASGSWLTFDDLSAATYEVFFVVWS